MSVGENGGASLYLAGKAFQHSHAGISGGFDRHNAI